MDRLRILINSSPRSGHTWLQYLLLNSLKNSNGVNMGATVDDFIVRTNVPVILNATFKDILQVSILRNPQDIIPSIVTKTMGGLGSNITSGIPMPHEMGNLPSIEKLVEDQFGIYKLWSSTMIDNLDKVMAFTFDQVTTDTEFVMSSIMKNFNVDYNIVLNQNIDLAIEDARVKIFHHDKGDIGFNNPVPIDKKPEIYYEIKKIVDRHRLLEPTLDIYNKASSLIKQSQLSWN
jgi:hypothetical protein